ncbi:GHMP kinase [Candidatus Thorarchaeota archaeon]|nr:MAG: GHMP kinase [Candidatus Thorarchaeota archaeon]
MPRRERRVLVPTMKGNIEFRVRVPGRVCLFGEHSDYLGLDVISASIDRYIELSVAPREDDVVTILYSDLDEKEHFSAESEAAYLKKRDYVRSAFNTIRRRGSRSLPGADITVAGRIPIAAGLSSSSALTVGAILVFARLAGLHLTPDDVARVAFQAEVLEFGESGGKQDHFTIAYGGIVHLDVGNDYRVTQLPAELSGLVIGNSGEQKEDTVGDLAHLRGTIEEEYETIKESIEEFDPRETDLEKVQSSSSQAQTVPRRMAEATLQNRDLTARAKKLLSKKIPNSEKLGQLIDDHHAILRDGLGRSTKKIERMIRAAKTAGALGCKINGSGGGGTILAYAPGKEREVMDAIESASGTAFEVSVGQGASLTRVR